MKPDIIELRKSVRERMGYLGNEITAREEMGLPTDGLYTELYGLKRKHRALKRRIREMRERQAAA